MKRLSIILAVLAVCSCGTPRQTSTTAVNNNFPKIDQKGKTAVVCHRGFWNCEAAGFSENSIASLKAAQEGGFWGSECDVQLTKDHVVIVNHNSTIGGKKIKDTLWEDLKGELLPNGERRPTIEEYLAQAAKCKTTKLIIELKPQKGSPESEDILVDKTIAAMKAAGMYNPSRVLFISFSRHICEKLAKEQPKFINQYLNGELSPAKLAELGINGFDYESALVGKKIISDAHELGMSTNVWTVNKEGRMKELIEAGVDAITTNEPLLLRSILGDKELKN